MRRRRPKLLSPRGLLAAAVVFGLFVLCDVALFGYLVLKSLSQREIEEVLLEVRREAEPLARALEEQAAASGQDDLFMVVSVSQVTETYIDSVLSRRDVVSKVEIRDAEGRVVWEKSAAAEQPVDPDVPRVETGGDNPETGALGIGSPLRQEVAIGNLGTLVVGLSEEQVQRRIAVLREDLVRQVLVIAVLTVTLLGLATVGMLVLMRRARRFEEQAEEAERLAYIGTLASGLAHEIRSPLNSLNLNMQMLEEGLLAGATPRAAGAAADDHRLLHITRSEISRLERLVTDFLSYARPRPLELEEVPAVELLERVREVLWGELKERRARLEVVDASEGARVRVDRAQMGQLLLNLTQNALDACRDTGRPACVELGVRREGGDVVLTVADEGRGIPEHEQGRVFDLFFSTRKGGTGLGLAIAQRIARAHDAALELESEIGVGTTVGVRLRRADGG